MIKKKDSLVVPGDELGSREENIPLSGVYIRDERLYSSQHGNIKEDKYRLYVSRKPSRRFFPERFSFLILRVDKKEERRFVLKVLGWIKINPKTQEPLRLVSDSQKTLNRSLIKVSLSADDRLLGMYEVGDWISVEMPPFRITESLLTLEQKLGDGIIRGLCRECHSIMDAESDHLLRCNICDSKRTTLMSRFYEIFKKKYRTP